MADRKRNRRDHPDDWPEHATAPLSSIVLVGKHDDATGKVIPYTDAELAEIKRRSMISFEAKRRQQRKPLSGRLRTAPVG